MVCLRPLDQAVITEVSKPGYRPSAADAQAFMQELSAALQHI
jgi:hypothetical protein